MPIPFPPSSVLIPIEMPEVSEIFPRIKLVKIAFGTLFEGIEVLFGSFRNRPQTGIRSIFVRRIENGIRCKNILPIQKDILPVASR